MEDFLSRARMIWAYSQMIDSIEKKIEDEIEEKISTYFEEEIASEIEEKFNAITDPLYSEYWKMREDYLEDFEDSDPKNSSLSYLIDQARKSWGIYDGEVVANRFLRDYKIIRTTTGREYRICAYVSQRSGKRIIIPVDEDLFDYVKICDGLDQICCEDNYPSKVKLVWNAFEEVYAPHPAQRIWTGKARKIYWVGQEDDERHLCVD